MHDVIDLKCTKNFVFELKMHHYRWRLVVRRRPYFLWPYNDLQTVGGWMIRNRNFHWTQLPGYAAAARYGRFQWHQSLYFLSKHAPKSLAAGAPPQTPLEELTEFYTLLERMEMRGKMNLLQISISWLRYCGKFKSHQKIPFWSKMHQNRWRLGLRPRPRWGNLQRSPKTPSC